MHDFNSHDRGACTFLSSSHFPIQDVEKDHFRFLSVALALLVDLADAAVNHLVDSEDSPAAADLHQVHKAPVVLEDSPAAAVVAVVPVEDHPIGSEVVVAAPAEPPVDAGTEEYFAVEVDILAVVHIAVAGGLVVAVVDVVRTVLELGEHHNDLIMNSLACSYRPRPRPQTPSSNLTWLFLEYLHDKIRKVGERENERNIDHFTVQTSNNEP